jgi:hypothetical protein
VAIEKKSVDTYMWQLKNFGCHNHLAIEFGHHRWICWQIWSPSDGDYVFWLP